MAADASDDLDRHRWQSALVGRMIHRGQVQEAVVVLATDGAFSRIEDAAIQFWLYFKKCTQQRSSAADLIVVKVLRHVDDDVNEILSRTVLI